MPWLKQVVTAASLGATMEERIIMDRVALPPRAERPRKARFAECWRLGRTVRTTTVVDCNGTVILDNVTIGPIFAQNSIAAVVFRNAKGSHAAVSRVVVKSVCSVRGFHNSGLG